MKIYIVVSFLLSTLYVQASDLFMQHKIDNSDIIMVDVLESVLQATDALILKQVEEVKGRIKNLIQVAQKAKDKRSRVYNIITIDHSIRTHSAASDTYVHYVVLCIEINSSICTDMTPDQLENLEKLILEKLIELYQAQKLGVEQVAVGVYVSCLQLGVEKIETK